MHTAYGPKSITEIQKDIPSAYQWLFPGREKGFKNIETFLYKISEFWKTSSCPLCGYFPILSLESSCYINLNWQFYSLSCLAGTTKSELISWGYESVQKSLNALGDGSHDPDPCSDLCCLRGEHNRQNRATRTFLRREIQAEEKERSRFLTTQCHIWRKRKTK